MALNRDQKCRTTAYLSATTTLLWMWQSAQPTFDNALPFLDISENGFQLRGPIQENEKLDSSSIVISVSEVIAMYVGVATMVSLYSLYWVCSDGNATFWQNMMFIFLATLASLGYGMHAVCVIAQLQISKDNPLYALLDFVHERWSHNMFQFGMFGLFLLLVWVEKPLVKFSATIVRLKAYKITPVPNVPLLHSLWKWFGPITTGLFVSIFSNRTETGYIALAFYVSIIVSFLLFAIQLNYKYYNIPLLLNQYTLLEFYLAVVTYGLPTIFIHSWFFM